MDDRSGTVFVVTLSLGVLATVFVALRVISKVWVVKRFTSDDTWAVIAWVFCTGVSATICAGARSGLGQPDAAIRPEWEESLKRSIYAFTVLYNPALMATKTSILILYIRMAAAHRFLRYASIATAVVVNLAGLVLTFIGLFQCKPFAAAYTDELDGECIDVVAMYLASAPINILTDLAILCLPLPILTGLRMEFKQKCALVCTFIVGGFVAIVDVVRILYLQNSLRETREFNAGSATITAATRPPNFTYHASFSLMWSAVEVSVGLMCCCVLVLKPLIMRVMPGFLGGTHRRESRMGHGTSGGSFQISDLSKDARSPESVVTPQLPAFDTTRQSVDLRPSIDLGSDTSRPSKPSLNTIPESPLSPMHIGGAENDDDDDDDDGGMDFFQMLSSDPSEVPPNAPPPTTPVIDTKPRKLSIVRRATLLSPLRPASMKLPDPPPVPLQEPTQNFFDFVNMKGKTPLTQLTAKEAWWPIMFVSILFFLWGFAYGLLGTLNGKIQSLLGYSAAETFALHNAYWIGYFLGPPLVGYWTLTREGFKATFIAGLAIYSCGALSYWPSSVLMSYPGFFVSNFIVALGLSVLENAANPFVALAGPGHLSESRLCFSQGIQGVGSVVSPILASRALFSGIGEDDLFRVQYCYLAVALFVVALAIVFYYVPLSEATDDELEAMAVQRLYNADLDSGEKVYGVDARKLLLYSGVVLMGTYVGAQECISYFWGSVSLGTYPTFSPATASSISQGLFALGRFLASALTYFLPPRYVLQGFILGSVISSVLAMALPAGPGALAFLLLLMFFQSAIFPLVFAMSMRGQGKHTKFAVTCITMAISGGAVWPSVVYGVDMSHRDDSRYSIRVTTGLYAVALLWPLLLSVNKTMRRWVDPKWSRQALASDHNQDGHPVTGDWPTPVMGGGKAMANHIEVTVEDIHDTPGLKGGGDMERKRSVTFENGNGNGYGIR